MNAVDSERLINQIIDHGLTPDPNLTVSEWADQFRVLSSKASAEPGRWKTSRTPFAKEIMDCLSPGSPYRRVVFQKAAQIGGTECGLNWLGAIIHLFPSPIMIVEPTIALARKLSKQKITPMLEDSSVLYGLVSEKRKQESNTILEKEFPGGILFIVGANSASGLKMISAKYVFLDEVDGYRQDISGEGDPVSLAEKRTTTFFNHKIYLASVPSIKNFSRIEQEYLLSDQRQYHVPCPYCNHEQILQFGNLVWDKDEENQPILNSVKLKCVSCGKLIEEGHKTQMLENGKWLRANPDSPIAGFHLNALYSPLGWKSWSAIVSDFYKAKGSRELLKTFTNAILAETWEESSEKLDEDTLFSRREHYTKVPMQVGVLTAGVDIQDNRIECEVVGWGRGEESWGIDFRIFPGNPVQDDVWQQLDEYLQSTFTHESGAKLKIVSVCIDTGAFTKRVYEWIKPRQGKRFYAVKGASISGKALVSRPSNQRGVLLYSLGTDGLKENLYSRLKLIEPGQAGYCHFPVSLNYDEEFFKQLTAEKIIVKYVKGFPVRQWIKWRERNEALDIRIYASAALILLNANLEALCDDLQKQAPVMKNKPEEKKVEEQKPPTEIVKVKMKRGITWKNNSILEKGQELDVSVREAHELLSIGAIYSVDIPRPPSVTPPKKPIQKSSWAQRY